MCTLYAYITRAECASSESDGEVGDGEAGDDAVRHVLQVPLQQQSEQDQPVADHDPHRNDCQRQQTPLRRGRGRRGRRVGKAVYCFKPAELRTSRLRSFHRRR